MTKEEALQGWIQLTMPYTIKTPFTNSVDADRSQCGNE